MILSFLPKFIYLEDYPELEGHQNIDQYIQRKNQGKITEKDKYFEKLMKVSGLNPVELQKLLSQEPELRQPLTNRAGAIITKKLRELWKDRALKVRFNLDAGHFDTLVSDPNAFYDVEVNLNERSRGFQWFFSFYITFAADTNNGSAKNAILLLDEPGLYLHAVAQRDLLNHFKNDFVNQIIYTTHSPFMVPIDNLTSIRTVSISPEEGTTVTNTPKGDSKTLFPLQAALGYDITQSLFIGEKNIIVEGVTDFWYLTSLSTYFESQGMNHLDKSIAVTPAGGASKITYMVSMLTSQNLKVVTLFDFDKSGKESAEDIIKQKLVREENVLFVNEAVKTSTEMDIEDLLDESLFASLANESYAKELKGLVLTLNPKIPRIVIRYEEAFKNIGLEFNKTRIANLFMRKLATDPSTVVTTFIQTNFISLFDIFNKKFNKIESLNRGIFNKNRF
jgi:predicted ATP-dependent endonuclease of OLD family